MGVTGKQTKHIVVSKEGVTKLLKGLNPSKALGPDELHPGVLKELASELGPVFAHLFQQSIDSGEIPKEWSLANICPLFKKADRSLACNYRPVSLTCVPCKLGTYSVFLLTLLRMNSLKANCSVMELVERQLNGLMPSFAIDNKELWLMALNQTGLLLYLVSHRAWFLAPCCFRCI